MAGKKRAGSKAKKEKHSRSYKRAEEAKAQAKARQEEAQKVNDAYRARGERTPYQERKREAYLKRIAEKYGEHD